MKILIAYATKHGFTKTCAHALAEKLNGEADICDLGNTKPDISKYDTVIIGGSVYMGKIRKPVRRFCENNLNELRGKGLGFFICGIAGDEDAEKQISSSFPEDLLGHAIAKEFFGGELAPEKHGPIMRKLVKSIQEKNPVKAGMRIDNINRMAEVFNRG